MARRSSRADFSPSAINSRPKTNTAPEDIIAPGKKSRQKTVSGGNSGKVGGGEGSGGSR